MTDDELIQEDELDRDEGGLVKTKEGKWHVFRNGEPFSCAQGDTNLLEPGGPYVDAMIVEDSDPLDPTTQEIREGLREKRDEGERICLKCATTYDVSFPKPSDDKADSTQVIAND